MSERKGSKKRRYKELTENLSKDEILRRLKSIMEELANVDQDDNTENYDELSATLVASFLINHKDKDIRVCLACCYADILRIYAPEAPYNEEQLKGIFELILSQLKIIENPDSALFKRAYYLLESLAMVKSFNVCCEIDAQHLVLTLFRTFFNVVNEKHSIKVKNFMLDVLASIIQDCESLSQEILDAVLINLVNPRKASKPSSYDLASKLIERCSTALEPFLQVFFNDSLVLGKETESDVENHIYDLILELNRIHKTILLSILPQLEFKLKSVEENERLEVVKVLGTLFSEKESDLSSMNKPLWKCFLERFIDISADVRVECLRSGKQLLISKPELANEVADRVLERFHDTEEKVRLQAVVSVCEAAAESMESVPEELMSAVKERMRDKKWPVRRAALTCTAKLYNSITIGQIADVSAEAINRISWVPVKILHSYYQNSIEDRLCVERIVHGCLVPVSLENDQRMNILLTLYASLDKYGLQAFDFLLKHRASINSEFKKLLDLHESNEEGKEKLMFAKILILARALPDPFKAQENLKKLVLMFKDESFFHLLKVSTDILLGCEQIKKAVAEIVKKISAKNPIIETVKALLDRSCHMLVDSRSVKMLFKCVKKSIEGMDDEDDDDDMEDNDCILSQRAKRGLLLLQALSKALPEIFKTRECYEELLQLIKHQDDFVVETGLRILFCVGENLEAFDRNLCACFQPVLSKLVVSGTRKQGIFAVRCLSRTQKDPTLVMDRLMNTLGKSLSYNSKTLMTSLASLGEIAIYAPSIFESQHKAIITDFVVKDLIIQDRDYSSDSQDGDDEWGFEDEVSTEAKLKVQAIKLMVKWLTGLQSDHAKLATPVFRLLSAILQKDGDLNGKGLIGIKDKARLRLVAAKSMIKLVQNVNYMNVITIDQFLQLAWTVQDSCYEVRQKFSAKLHVSLEVLKLPLDYLAFFMLSAVDPVKDQRNLARQMITKNIQTRRDYVKQNPVVANRPYAVRPEYALPYVIYLMAHNPDFDPTKTDSLSEAKEYIWFFLEPLLGNKAENSSFLKKVAENVKQVRDAQDPDNDDVNQKVYVICDIVIWLLANKVHTLVLNEFPGNPVLPKKLFSTAKKRTNPNTKNYLPASFLQSPKAKKPAVVTLKTTSRKTAPSSRTTRTRVKGEEFKILASKVVEEEQDEDLDEDLVMILEENETENAVKDATAETRKRPKATSKTKVMEKNSNQRRLEDLMRKDKEKTNQNSKRVKLRQAKKEDGNESDGENDESAHPSDISSAMAESEEDQMEDKAQEVPVVSKGKRINSNDDKEDEEEYEEKPEMKGKEEQINEEKSDEEKRVEDENPAEEDDTSMVFNVKRKRTRRR